MPRQRKQTESGADVPRTALPAVRRALGELRELDLDLLDLIRPFATVGMEGPDLHTPRPLLRIVPGKLAGSPHIVHTRIETLVIDALGKRDLSPERIRALYPVVEAAAITDALDLERQLRRNLAA